MTSGTERKLSLRRTLAQMGATGRAHAGVLTLAALIVFIPLGLADVLDEELQGAFHDFDWSDMNAGDIVLVFVAAFAHSLFALGGEVFFAGVVAAAVMATRAEGRQPRLRELARHLPYLRLIAVDLLYALAVAAGAILFIVPGVLALAWFALVGPVVEIEDARPVAAFRRSRALVRGNTGRVIALLLPIQLVSDAVSSLVRSSTIGSIGDTFLGDWAAATATEIVSAPLIALAAVVIFLELRGNDSISQ